LNHPFLPLSPPRVRAVAVSVAIRCDGGGRIDIAPPAAAGVRPSLRAYGYSVQYGRVPADVVTRLLTADGRWEVTFSEDGY
jgi:hypothetical protein